MKATLPPRWHDTPFVIQTTARRRPRPQRNVDRVAAPRGILLGAAIGIGLWIGVIALMS